MIFKMTTREKITIEILLSVLKKTFNHFALEVKLVNNNMTFRLLECELLVLRA